MADYAINPPDHGSPQTNMFIGENGLRAGWRLLIYLAIVVAASTGITFVALKIFHPHRGPLTGWIVLWQELFGLLVVFGAALIMSRIERRPVGPYGLPGAEMFGGKFWLGFLFGLAEISLLIALISAFGGYTFGSLALQGSAILKMGLLYLVAFICVGLFEEFAFRGYTQYTLADGIGFWPAALILSALFGAAHLSNPGEGWVGAASVVAIALLFCFSLKRSGNLWYAVGLHASFDWGETYLYSVPNSGAVMQGHLSNAVLHAGPRWLTGGTVGPEGSVFCFLTIALQFLVVMWLFPVKKNEVAVPNPHSSD
ncbi:MAG: type II CAAX endopeptidase family protein [Candidatus Acidiferrum sp.]